MASPNKRSSRDKGISELNDSLTKLSQQTGTRQEAIDYVLSYMDNAPRLWADASPDMRALYQSMIFPDDIEYNFHTNKFRPLNMTALYTLANIKKDPSLADESFLATPRRIRRYNPPVLSAICGRGISDSPRAKARLYGVRLSLGHYQIKTLYSRRVFLFGDPKENRPRSAGPEFSCVEQVQP